VTLDIQEILISISLIVVALILFWGIITMARGGEYNKNKSNIIMRYRIIFQAIAIITFIVILLLRNN
jgi:cytochrome c oxidase assembly factor CtaG|tara:strand:- start:135 stop:335 length:201 start_codon:yes stop_codon:yes gene_type:complete